jgi:hypothetical protein
MIGSGPDRHSQGNEQVSWWELSPVIGLSFLFRMPDRYVTWVTDIPAIMKYAPW